MAYDNYIDSKVNLVIEVDIWAEQNNPLFMNKMEEILESSKHRSYEDLAYGDTKTFRKVFNLAKSKAKKIRKG